ncbi:transducin/WD40 repeat-like superfamily protein [Wolffia australiana]
MKKKNKVYSQDVSDEVQAVAHKYLRGHGADLEVLEDKKLKGQLSVKEQLYGESAKAAAKTEKWIMPCMSGLLEAEGLEKTWRIKQEAIVSEVDILNSRKAYDISLRDALLGPYTLVYSLNGRNMLIAGRKGDLAIIDMLTMKLIKNFQVKETVRDVVFLHDGQTFAAAQKKYVYIYSKEGTELHCLREHEAPLSLQYLYKHFLLSSVNKLGQLRYQDVSTGQMVANYRTGLGGTRAMRVNPFNSVVALGHAGGKVTMWKPTSVKPLVSMLCHHGPITALAFHSDGHLMATAGMDRKIKLWDLRKYQVIRSFAGHAKTLDLSDRGLLAIGNGSFVDVWHDTAGDHSFKPYMNHSMAKGFQIGKVCFRPYEDVLGIGHSHGVSSILVPGSGEPNFDSWVANPYESTKQKREKEIHNLLDKLPPETIMLDPGKIGSVRPTKTRVAAVDEREVEGEARDVAIAEAKAAAVVKNKTKGRNKPSKMLKKKQDEVARVKRKFIEVAPDQPRKKIKEVELAEVPRSLQRFAKKKPL